VKGLGRATDLENRIARLRNLNPQLKGLGRAADLENYIAYFRNLNPQLKGLGRAADLESRIARPSIVLSYSPLGSSSYY